MRIVLVLPDLLHRGGAANLTMWLAAGLRGRGHDVTLCAAGIDRDVWPDETLSGMRLVDLPDRNQGFWHQFSRSRRHGRIIAGEAAGADLLVAGNHPSHWWVADALPRMTPEPAAVMYCHEPLRKFYFPVTDRPTVDYVRSDRRTLPFHDWLSHGVSYRLKSYRLGKVPVARWWDSRLVRRLDAVLANSTVTGSHAQRVWHLPTTVCLPGAPSPSETGNELSISQRQGVLVMSGWDVAKNPMGVLGTIDHVVNRLGRRDIRFTIAGGGFITQYKEYVDRHGLSDAIDVKGFVTDEDKDDLLRSARLCLFVPLAEPFGLVAVEAMARGTPVVASNHGGPAEVVEDGVSGALVDPYDPEAIAEAVVRTFDAEDWEAMSHAATRRARGRFTIDAFLDRFEAAVAGVKPA